MRKQTEVVGAFKFFKRVRSGHTAAPATPLGRLRSWLCSHPGKNPVVPSYVPEACQSPSSVKCMATPPALPLYRTVVLYTYAHTHAHRSMMFALHLGLHIRHWQPACRAHRQRPRRPADGAVPSCSQGPDSEDGDPSAQMVQVGFLPACPCHRQRLLEVLVPVQATGSPVWCGGKHTQSLHSYADGSTTPRRLVALAT